MSLPYRDQTNVVSKTLTTVIATKLLDGTSVRQMQVAKIRKDGVCESATYEYWRRVGSKYYEISRDVYMDLLGAKPLATPSKKFKPSKLRI